MRALLLYLLPIILLLLSLFAIGSRRSAADDQKPSDSEYSDAHPSRGIEGETLIE